MIVLGNVLLRYNGSSKELVIPEGIHMIGINAYNSDTIEKNNSIFNSRSYR